MSFPARSWLKRTHLERGTYHFSTGGSGFFFVFFLNIILLFFYRIALGWEALVSAQGIQDKALEQIKRDKSGRTRCGFSHRYQPHYLTFNTLSSLRRRTAITRQRKKASASTPKRRTAKRDAGAERNACYETMTAVCFYSCWLFGGSIVLGGFGMKNERWDMRLRHYPGSIARCGLSHQQYVYPPLDAPAKVEQFREVGWEQASR